MIDPGALCPDGCRSQLKQIVENRPAVILEFRFCDDEKYASRFQVAVVLSRRSHKLDASLFKPRKIVCMVHAALRIRLLIADADLDFVAVEHGRSIPSTCLYL